MRRTLGVGGATAVAIGATLALAGVASAHTPVFTPGCVGSTTTPTLKVDLSNYTSSNKHNNTVAVTYLPDGASKSVTIQPTTNFQSSWDSPTHYSKTNPFFVDGNVGGTFTITITAWDDEPPVVSKSQHGNGSKQQWDGTFSVSVKTCPGNGTPPPTTTTAPPPTTTTAPPTSGTTAPPTTTGSSSAPTTTKPAVVAAAPTTPGSGGGLAYTGVSAELPLILGGALVVIGAGSLFAMRILKRRRAEH